MNGGPANATPKRCNANNAASCTDRPTQRTSETQARSAYGMLIGAIGVTDGPAHGHAGSARAYTNAPVMTTALRRARLMTLAAPREKEDY